MGGRGDDGSTGARWVALFALVLIAAAVVHAFAEAWVCDDAFISFRYARHLIEGHGLVYNVGEDPVEGYTNFLWTILVAGGMALGFDAVGFGNAAGIAFFLGTMLLMLFASRRIGVGAWFPVAAVGLSLHHHAKVFASCGLETAMFAFLVTLLLVVLFEADRASRFLWAGVIGVAAAMTRPDGMLVYGLAGLFTLALAIRHRRWGWFGAIVLPGVVLYLPYFAWKWSYYGWPLPNTFYAKSAAQSYLSQGWLYVTLYFRCYYVLIAALAGVALFTVRGLRTWDRFDRGMGGRGPVLVALFVLPYLAFVVWVGGDFMFTRFCLPITPALFFGLEFVRARLRPAWAIGFGVVVGALTFLHWYPDIVRAEGRPAGVTEEKDFYPPEKMEAIRAIGEQLAEITEGTDARVVIYGGQAVLAYYGRFALVIEGATGLTDEYIAHMPIAERGRIGHEKFAPMQYLYQRRVDFRLGYKLYEDPIAPLRVFDFGPMRGTFLIYRRELVDKLVERGAQVQRFEDYLDLYLTQLEGKTREQLLVDYNWFKLYYFDHNEDPERQRRLEAALK